MRSLLIDNYDSFTYNLADLAYRAFGEYPTVVTHDRPFEELDLAGIEAILVSPGPGRPQRAGDLGASWGAVEQGEIPVLGVCLGLQAIALEAGARVGLAPEPRHGRPSRIRHDGEGLWRGLGQGIEAVRYHSLAADRLPDSLKATAWSEDDVVMGLERTDKPQWGIQFHPESIGTPDGLAMLQNFRRLVEGKSASAPSRPAAAPAPAARGPRPGEGGYRVRWRRVDAEPDARALFERLYGASSRRFWLDSSASGAPQAGRTIMGDDSGPLSEALRYDVDSREATVETAGGEQSLPAPDGFFALLGERIAKRAAPAPEGLPFDFSLGYVGTLGFELGHELPGRGEGRFSSPLPDASLLLADRAVVLEHAERVTYLLALEGPDSGNAAGEWLSAAARVVEEVAASGPAGEAAEEAPAGGAEYRLEQDRGEYMDSVRACLEAIRQGESYELCLTQTAEGPALDDAYATFRRLRSLSEVPFAAFLEDDDVAVLSASPERFLKVDREGLVEARPIKGTRPRGRDAAEDEALAAELAGSEKDRAENLMIVDLLRNDLNRSCRRGTVAVPGLFEVESFSHVHQLVSTITGRLAEGVDAAECVRWAFPGGSMTGAPKLRTLELLDGLERRARGIYSGAIGWFSLSGACDLSITIRTIVSEPGRSTIGVGGAITAQSDPAAEFEEILVKALAPLAAVGGRIAGEDA